MQTQFNAPQQDMYAAALARIKANSAAKRGMALRSANAAGVANSGVGQIPIAQVNNEEELAANQAGAQIAAQQDQERLQEKEFGQRKELMALGNEYSLAQQAEAYRRQKAMAGNQLFGQIAGGGLAGLGSYFGNKG